MVWSGMILAPLGLVSPRGSIFAVAYWAAITALVWAMTATVFWSTMSRNWTAGAPPSPKSSSLAGALTLWFISTVIFATLVFPNIPPWLGGGAPRPVSVVWDASLDREERALLVGEPNKRCLFELHSNQSDLFLVSVEPERAEACSLPRWLPEALRRRDARFPTYLVVPRSRARVVTYLPEATL